MRLIFNIFKCMNSAAAVVNSDFCLCTVNSCDFIVHALKKKKKVETEMRKMHNPNGYKVWVWIWLLRLRLPLFFFFFFPTHAFRRTNGYCS